MYRVKRREQLCVTHQALMSLPQFDRSPTPYPKIQQPLRKHRIPDLAVPQPAKTHKLNLDSKGLLLYVREITQDKCTNPKQMYMWIITLNYFNNINYFHFPNVLLTVLQLATLLSLFLALAPVGWSPLTLGSSDSE